MTTRRSLVIFASLASILLLAALYVWKKNTSPSDVNSVKSSPPAHFTGSAACVSCHQPEAEQWQNSDHHRAMELADEQTVLGNFDNSSFTYFGRKTVFFRQNGQFLVKTENQDGKIETFVVAYTLGYKPLQQYLVKFPDGRIQTLPFSWDTRANKQGGQRWFHIYPNDNIKPDDPLFWTRTMQNWNHMCADCHTTNFAKNFSDEKNNFDSHWTELSNGCESCHGAGSAHIELMKNVKEKTKTDLLINRLKTQTAQMDQCGVCHARRTRLKEGSANEKMMQSWQPELLHDNLYFTDGQMHDEVFNVGSFMQSKMYSAGVSCSNCHDSHSSKLKIEGNALCTQCHNKTNYDTEKHHFHLMNTTGAQCVECHMPTQTYMVVDPRHDHSFSIPRPDLSIKLGGNSSVPNACVSCHQEKLQQKKRDSHWATNAISNHMKKIGKSPIHPHAFAESFWLARHEQVAAESALKKLVADNSVNSIVKATALLQLGNYLNPDSLVLIKTQLGNNDAIVRYGAVEALSAATPEQRIPLLLTVLNDNSSAVRLAAAPLLAEIDKATLSATQQKQLGNIFSEYKKWLLADSDRGNALVNLANFYLMQGDIVMAQQYLDKALQRDEKSLSVLLNYADYHRHTNNDGAAEKLLRKAISIYPDSADAHYALGLLLVRVKNYPEAMRELKQATSLAPLSSQYAYVYAIGLYSTGSIGQAMSVLLQARDQFPANPSINAALYAYCGEQQQDSHFQKTYCSSIDTRK